MKFILSQELSRHNRDKKCSPMEPINYKTYEISYETIEILPSYTIITPTTLGSEVNTNANGSSEVFLIPPISNANQSNFEILESTNAENVNAEAIGTVKSWNCGLCAFQ